MVEQLFKIKKSKYQFKGGNYSIKKYFLEQRRGLQQWKSLIDRKFLLQNKRKRGFLPQIWKWRWNRKSNMAWKSLRFITHSRVNNFYQVRVRKYFLTQFLLKKAKKWRFQFTPNNLKYTTSSLVAERLDNILVKTYVSRNITNARLLVKGSCVIVNGVITYDYNRSIVYGDIIQIRGNFFKKVVQPLAELRYLSLDRKGR